MSYATGTTHYNLPQTVGTDKRDWADTNQAFSDIDAAIYGAVSDVATAGTAISGLETRMTTAEGNISDNAANITSLDTRMTTAEGAITAQGSQISDVKQDTEDMICAYNEASATSTHAYAIGDYFIYNDVLYKATQAIAIGDTIVPDTNCSTTNVTTELLTTEDLSDDVTQLQTDMTAAQQDITDLNSAVADLEGAKVLYTHTHVEGENLRSALMPCVQYIAALTNNDEKYRCHILVDGDIYDVTRVDSGNNIAIANTRPSTTISNPPLTISTAVLLSSDNELHNYGRFSIDVGGVTRTSLDTINALSDSVVLKY